MRNRSKNKAHRPKTGQAIAAEGKLVTFPKSDPSNSLVQFARFGGQSTDGTTAAK
jgi:hypothetical protein